MRYISQAIANLSVIFLTLGVRNDWSKGCLVTLIVVSALSCFWLGVETAKEDGL